METKNKISGIVFLLIGILQMVRFFSGWPIIANGHTIPVGLSLIAGIVFLGLAFWNLKSACCHKAQ